MPRNENPEWTDKMFKNAKAGKAALAEMFGKDTANALLSGKFTVKPVRVGRPTEDYPKKQVTLRIDQDILGAFKAMGRGWQTQMNNALRQFLAGLA